MKGVFGNEGALRFFARLTRAFPHGRWVVAVDLPPDEDRSGVRIAPPLLFVFPIISCLILEWLVPTSFIHGPARWTIGCLIFAAGAFLNVGGFLTQKRAGTDPIPFTPSTKIVSHGFYRFTRNPMYIGFALWTLGTAILCNSLWMLLAAPIGLVLVDRFVVVGEERYLERKFGEEYLGYKRRVRRWI